MKTFWKSFAVRTKWKTWHRDSCFIESFCDLLLTSLCCLICENAFIDKVSAIISSWLDFVAFFSFLPVQWCFCHLAFLGHYFWSMLFYKPLAFYYFLSLLMLPPNSFYRLSSQGFCHIYFPKNKAYLADVIFPGMLCFTSPKKKEEREKKNLLAWCKPSALCLPTAAAMKHNVTTQKRRAGEHMSSWSIRGSVRRAGEIWCRPTGDCRGSGVGWVQLCLMSAVWGLLSPQTG